MDDKWTIYEPKSRRYFKMTFDDVMKVIESLNKKIEAETILWNEVFRMFELTALSIGEMPFEYDKISSHLDFSIETDDFAPLTVIDYIKN